jgi:signal transduction histidine kinase
LIIADTEKAILGAQLAISNIKEAKRASELVIANIEGAHNAAELILTNKDLFYKNSEKSKRTAELIIASVAKTKRAAEVIILNVKKSLHAGELVISNKEVILTREKAKLTAELVVINNELMQSLQLNADKDLFISTLAHDLRGPFTVLLGMSDLLIENIHKHTIDEIEKFVVIIKNSAQDTFTLLEDLLMWIRAQSGKMTIALENQSLNEICKTMVESFSSIAGTKDITIQIKVPVELIVYADIDMLKIVLRNLISNAIKFTEYGGTIEISAEQSESEILITVRDNGIGIKPDDLEKLFHISKMKSSMGTDKETGTGLGLLLCKEFVEKHRGKIWVESEFGKGSEFKFTIPVFSDLVD